MVVAVTASLAVTMGVVEEMGVAPGLALTMGVTEEPAPAPGLVVTMGVVEEMGVAPGLVVTMGVVEEPARAPGLAVTMGAVEEPAPATGLSVALGVAEETAVATGLADALGATEQHACHAVTHTLHHAVPDNVMARPFWQNSPAPALSVVGIVPAGQDVLVDVVDPLVKGNGIVAFWRRYLHPNYIWAEGTISVNVMLRDDGLVTVSYGGVVNPTTGDN